MNLQQQLSALANAVKLLERATSGVNAAEPAITAAMAVIGKIVKGLPDDFRREQAWSQARPQVLHALTRAAEVVGKQTYLQMALATPEQAAWAAAYISTPEGFKFSSDMPGAAAARRAEALATGANPAYMPRTVEAFPGSTFTTKDLLFAGSSPDLLGRLQQRVPDDVRALIERVQISGYTLRDWFGKSAVITDEAGLFVAGGQRLGGTTTVMVGGTDVPRWASFSFTSIDRQVRAGFLGGVNTEEIARNLIFDEIRGQMRLGTGAVRLKADARAIARTGLMALSDQAHEAQWAAMEEDLGRPLVLRRRWDSSTDSRACPTCSLLDGREWEEPAMPPPRPHPNCRCMVLPVTATELELRRTGDSIHQREKVTAVELTDQEPPKQKGNETRAQYRDRMADEGWFLTKGRGPSGERWNRRRVVREGQGVTDWLGAAAKESSGKHSARVSLQEYFGGNDAGAKRAEYFRRQVARGTDPRDALQQMLRNVGGADNQASWVPVKQLEAVMPELKTVEAIHSTRQQREVARARKANGGAKVPISAIPRPRRGY